MTDIPTDKTPDPASMVPVKNDCAVMRHVVGDVGVTSASDGKTMSFQPSTRV